VFLSKWHPKILPRHPKFWKPKYVFALHWNKTIWGKHVFLHVVIATDGCNVIGRHNFLAQKLEAKIVSMVSVYCHAHRLASACYYTAADLYSTVYETAKAFAIMEVFYCFTVAIGLPGGVSDCNDGKMSVVAARMQNKVVVEWGNNETRSEILTIWAALKQMSENKNDAMCVVLLRLLKTKNFNMVLSFCQNCHLTWQNWAKFFRRDVLTLLRWKLPQNCISISSLMPLLNPSLKVTAKSLIANQENLERRVVWLTRVCQVAWRFGRAPKDWQIDHTHT